MNELIESIGPGEDVFLLCVTDGEDQESILTYEEITGAISVRGNIKLRILDITGKLKETENDPGDYIEKIDDIESIDIDLGIQSAAL